MQKKKEKREGATTAPARPGDWGDCSTASGAASPVIDVEFVMFSGKKC